MPGTLKTLLFALSLCFFAPLAGAETMFVHGSWVNVRETAAADATVIDHVTANTPVQVLAREGKACEIVWGKEDEKRGFVACRLLGEKALKLVDVSLAESHRRHESTGKTLQDSPPRAFWVAPSAVALMGAGKYFERTLLPEKQRDMESQYYGDEQTAKAIPRPPLLRWPVPEFEAMKALLAEGIVADASRDTSLVSCRQIEKPPNFNRHWWGWGNENYYEHGLLLSSCQTPTATILSLPKIAPSFFKTTEGILPGVADVEQISAHFGIVERGRVVRGPRWVSDYEHGRDYWNRYEGNWDIGHYELKLERPVFEHVVGRDGRISIYQWTPSFSRLLHSNFAAEDNNYDCGNSNGQFMNWRQGKKILLPDYSAANDAMFWFQSPVALPFKQARILQHKTGVADVENNEIPIESYDIDLDGDGIADFAQWDFNTQNVTRPDFYTDVGDNSPPLRVIFVNINGEWYPFEKYSAITCGC